MGLLVDTANVLHQTGVLPRDMAGVDLRALGALIKASRWGQDRVLLVCDGPPPGPHQGLPTGMHAAFSGHDRSADDLIEDRIAASSAPRSLTVVSSDRRIIKAARRRRCRRLSSEAFLRHLVHDAQRRRPPSTTGSKDVELPPDMIAQAQAMADDHRLPPVPDKPAAIESQTSDVPNPPPPTDDGPLPASIIEEARRLLRDA